MHYLYVIYSKSISRFYIGETQNPEERLVKYNSTTYQKAYTKAANDWVLKLAYKCENRNDAMYIEQFIKRMKSVKFTEKIIANPKILDDLLDKR